MALAWHCDYVNCDTWQIVGPSLLFIEVHEHTSDFDGILHFCSWDCLLKFSAGMKPLRIV